MKTNFLFLFLIALLTACGGGTKVVPVAERIQKSWSAQSVKEGTTPVFTKGGSSTKPGYGSFRLELASGGVARFTDFDGITCIGTWAISSDEKTLTLTGLTPPPTGTNGTISFTISSLTDNSLTITRTTASLKTGGTINEYQLVNP
ncbi:hypothetical protein [Fibrella aquatilis]|uniref:Lipocalin-like domain-containing protein n=1 Tax=Fibrella aquatilis TaxID=2817059 RepID=A0A939K1S1_9BACT|nr:hypothetical protein [Fibrella aquatilis]MBO0933818.1 hypothetical protein [Fibrella aquatilis]